MFNNKLCAQIKIRARLRLLNKFWRLPKIAGKMRKRKNPVDYSIVENDYGLQIVSIFNIQKCDSTSATIIKGIAGCLITVVISLMFS